MRFAGAISGDASEPGACCARIMGIWHDVALSERTSLGHWETGSCVFSEIWCGGNWGRMRNANNMSGQSEVVWGGVIGRLEKNANGREVTAEFPIEMVVDVVVRLTEILFGNVSRLEEHGHKILPDLHERFGRCFRTQGVLCTYYRRLACCGTVGGDLSGTQGDWLMRF